MVSARLREQVLADLHQGHPGVEGMTSLTRLHVWWPGIDGDIEKLVGGCSSCHLHRDALAVAPLHLWEYPKKKPWQHLHLDFAGLFYNWMWLIIVAARTKGPEVIRLKQAMSSITLMALLLDLGNLTFW